MFDANESNSYIERQLFLCLFQNTKSEKKINDNTQPLCDSVLTNSEHLRFAMVQLIEIWSVLKNSQFDCWNECHNRLWDTYGHGDTTVDVSHCAVFVTTDSVTRMIVREKQWVPVVTWSCVRNCKRPPIHTSGTVNWSEMYFIKTGFLFIALLACFLSYNFGDSCEYAVI